MVGRIKEISELRDLYYGNKSEFVAIYGRRRVGKTYLIDETFRNEITFRHAGLSPIEMKNNEKVRPLKQQLQAFYYSLLQHGMEKRNCPKDWLEAFFMLEMLLQKKDDGTRQLIFLDEIPWMDTPKSGFITALESFWNGWACHRPNVMIIVCGSANSWIKDKLINNHGGLYGRITYEIKLEPFSLKETEMLLKERGVKLSRYDIVQSYMILGGIPYYLNYFKRGESLAQNIDELFFSKGAKLREEFDRLFASIFSNPEVMKSIIMLLNQRSMGFTRSDISRLIKIPDGGNLSKALKALEVSDFIIKYVPFGFSKKEEYYKLVDPFCIFYVKFVYKRNNIEEGFWLHNVKSHSISTWRGYAFENVCFNHISQIKDALKIGGINSEQSAWIARGDEKEGTQIDLLICRADNVVNMCEIKYYGDSFVVDKKYDMLLKSRQNVLLDKLSPKCIVHNTLITTFGIQDNEYKWAFDNIITLDDLFK